jgi:ELWxxDGT repeat protein
MFSCNDVFALAMSVLLRSSTLCFVLLGWTLVGGGLLPVQAQSPIDINEGTRGSRPRSSVVVDGTIYFGADGGAEGRALWRTDGTAAGTRLVKDIDPTDDRSSIGPFFNLGGQLLFFAEDGTNGKELWTSDGTAAGTRLVTEIAPGPQGGLDIDGFPTDPFALYDGQLFFAADDGSSGTELWKTDGTAGGTQRVKDINQGSGFDGGSVPDLLTVADGTLYFTAYNGLFGTELWKTDGTTDGTERVTDLADGSASASIRELTEAGGQLFFVADDASGQGELWTSDGTSGGTQIVRDIAEGGAPDQLTEVGSTLFFEVDKASVNESLLWKSDGTAGTTEPVKTITGSRLASFAAAGSTLYFASDGDPGQLWTSDGTTDGTVALADLPGSNSRVRDITPVGEAVFFAGRDDTHGEELWSSLGTPATTGLVKDLYPGTEGSNPSRFVQAGDRLLFSAEGQSVGTELWTTGPTQTLALAAGDTPEKALSALDLTIDVAQAGSAFQLLAFRDPNVATAGLPDGQALAATGLWTVRAGDPGSVEAELCFGLDRLTAPRPAIDVTRLRVYRRADASSAWSRVPDADVRLRSDGTTPDPDALCATVTSFSEFAVTAAPSALPVEIASFEGRRAGNGVVHLRWRTAGEQNNAGFRVERRRVSPPDAEGAGGDWTRVGDVESKAAGGTTTEALTYRFRDADVPFAAGALRYRLTQVDTDGTTSRLGVVTVARGAVDDLTLKAPYPNPARSTVTAKLAVPEGRSGVAHLSLYNGLGQEVRTVRVDGSGRQRIELETDGLASGTYFLRLHAGDATETRRVVVVR